MGNDSNILIEKNHVAVFIALSQSAHHLGGVFQALADRGWSACAETMQTGVPIRLTSRMLRQARVIVHADCTGTNAITIHNTPIEPTQPIQPILLQMDGVLEYANTFLNTNAGEQLLQPAPANVVLASGVHDRSILQALGNRAVATGLPRLGRFADRVQAQRVESCQGILVASANQPAFTQGARSRLIASFKHIKAYAAKQNLPIRWRIESTIAYELGVENDETELAESLAQVRCVLTSASTLAIESMIANKPTAIIHPHPWPLWIPCAWRYDGETSDTDEGIAQDLATIDALQGKDRKANAAAADSITKIYAQTTPITTRSLNELFDALLDPAPELMALQERIVQRYTRPNPEKRVARVIERVASSSTLRPEANHRPARIPEPKGALIEAFDAMRKDQAFRITIVASRAPTPELAMLAEHRFNQIERFIVLAEPNTSTLLGIPAVSYAHIDKLISPEHPVLIAPQGDCELIVASRALRSSGIHPLVCPDPEAIAHTDAVLDAAQAALAQGPVRTTLKEPSIEGVKHCSPAQILRGDRPAMLVLKGDEIDFELYRRSRAWRDEGTIVRSLRWSDAELSSPERFASMVQTLNNQPYAIYASGLHTHRLLKYAPLTHPPRMILDDHAPEGMLGTIPVIQPQSLHEKEVGTVILSSLAHEPTLWAQSAHLRQRGIRVLGLYGAGMVGAEAEP